MMTVPANQPVSFTVYMQAIGNALPVPHAFIEAHLQRIHRAFEMGESASMIIDELKVRWEVTRGQWQKSPRQLAQRVVR